MQSARSLLANLTPKGRLVLGVSALAVILFAFVLFQVATKPSFSPVATGLDPAETGKITKALDEKGVTYEVQANGTTVAVEKAQMADARIALAESGGVSTGKPGFELFDKQKLGASDFQQKVSYQRALEGELARTIGQVNGVSEASVQLTLPEDELFAEEQKAATAAVLLSGSDQLDPASVRGIARLVSSSVEGLKPENVTITDATGALIWPNGEAGGEGGGGTSKMSADNRYERDMESNLDALLARTIGMGKGRVEVNADVDADQSTQDKLEYSRKGVPLTTRTETEKLQGAAGPGGATGTTGNIPNYAQGAAGGSKYNRENEETTNALNKTVTRTKIAPGTLRRQDVALVLDKSVSAADVRELRKAVTAAAGIDRKRRDTLSVSQLAFAKPEVPAGEGMMPKILSMGKVAGLVLATLLFLFFSTRWLRKRQEEELAAEPVWLRELEAPTTLAELEQTQVMAPPASRRDTLRDQVGDMAAQEPERVAQQVRAWMNEG